MSELQSSNRGLIATAKRQPGKTGTLVLLVLLMSFVWGRILLGGEDSKKKSSKSSKPAAEKSVAKDTAAKKESSKSSKSKSKEKSSKEEPTVKLDPIKNFNTAVARIETWRRPLGIEKAAPLTAEYLEQRRQEAEAHRIARNARADLAREAGAKANEEANSGLVALPDLIESALASATSEEPAIEASGVPTVYSTTPLMVDEEVEVDLNLTGTLILGNTRIALFGDRRIQEGERYGRYYLQAVRAREVDVVVDGKLLTVRMPDPEIQFGG